MFSSSDREHPRLVNAFLSHKYSASDVNVFFHKLISTVATIIFRVDRGKFQTSTTRLERMIRDADAFVGVWPLPGDARAAWDRDAMAVESRYFRLELNMAIRARKPGIVFSDRRYANLLQPPTWMTHLHYDPQELQLPTSSPSWAGLQGKIDAFWQGVDAQLANRVITTSLDKGSVGILFGRYNDVDAADLAEEAVSRLGYDPLRLRNQVSIAALRDMQRCDWVIADTTDPAIETITAFLYGQFVPVLRAHRVSEDIRPSAVEQLLFDDLTVGYRKDVIRWSTEAELQAGLRERLDVITQQAELIGNQVDAITYFSSAAKRKDTVFLSYAGADSDRGAEFAAELRQRFRDVFDYRDGNSLHAGDYWQDQISRKLSGSAVGVILFSRHYGKSNYCMEEARHLYRGFLKGQAKLLMVKLDDAPVPRFLSSIQYDRLSQSSPAQIVEQFTRNLG
jgi:TIR domain